MPNPHVATRILVSATGEGTLGVFLVNPGADGVSVIAEAADRQIHRELALDGVVVAETDVVGDPDRRRRGDRLATHPAKLGLAALAVGVCEQALRDTAEYTSERHQFGRPLSTNQGVALRAADTYIDTEAMRAVLWSTGPGGSPRACPPSRRSPSPSGGPPRAGRG